MVASLESPKYPWLTGRSVAPRRRKKYLPSEGFVRRVCGRSASNIGKPRATVAFAGRILQADSPLAIRKSVEASHRRDPPRGRPRREALAQLNRGGRRHLASPIGRHGPEAHIRTSSRCRCRRKRRSRCSCRPSSPFPRMSHAPLPARSPTFSRCPRAPPARLACSSHRYADFQYWAESPSVPPGNCSADWCSAGRSPLE